MAESSDQRTPPVFIIGCGRSGTTLLRMVLDSHRNISCGTETHFLEDMREIVGKHWDRLENYGFGKEYWYERISDFFDDFKSEYARKRGRGRWVEKTPHYTEHLDFIDRLFPRAQYIHLIRDGRDVVQSYRDRWNFRTALKAAGYWWPVRVRKARGMGSQVGSERYQEIQYEQLVRNPEPVLRDLLSFLGEQWDPAVLRFDEEEHDADQFFGEHTEKRREESGDKSRFYTSSIGRGQNLNPVLKGVLFYQGGDLMKQLGYSS